jgi:hypothetical protein
MATGLQIVIKRTPSMIEPFQAVLAELEAAFRRVEVQVPPPVPVERGDGYVFRYEEKLVQQAILMKFARYISGLRSAHVLLENGYCQELGVIQRTLDEIEEDISFLTLGLTGDMTDRHKEYLDHFWMENPGPSTVRRDKIRAFVNGSMDDPSSANDAGRTIFRTFSAFVHATSVSVIDMCAGDPPRYQLAGMLDSPLYADHTEDIWNNFYRGLVSAVFVAKAFNDEALMDERLSSMRAFQKEHADKVMPA